MKKEYILLILSFIIFNLVSFNLKAIENVLSLGGSYGYSNNSLEHNIATKYQENPGCNTDNSEISDPNCPKWKWNYINKAINNINNHSLNLSLEYQARLVSNIIIGVTNNYANNSINTGNYGVNLTDNSLELMVLLLLPLYQKNDFILRWGGNIGAGFSSLSTNIDLQKYQSNANKYYMVGNLLLDAEYNITDKVMLFSRANIKIGNPFVDGQSIGNVYNNSFKNNEQIQFENQHPEILTTENTMFLKQSYISAGIGFGIRYVLSK